MSDRECEHDDCIYNWCFRKAENWEPEPVEVIVSKSPRAVMSISLNRQQLEELDKRAEPMGMTVSRYIKWFLFNANQQEIPAISSSHPFTYRVGNWTGGGR